MNPADLHRRGLAPGKLVRVASRRGDVVVPLLADDRIGGGQADIAMHWGPEYLGGRDAKGKPRNGINALTTPAFCPDSKQPELKHAAVSVQAADLPWRVMAARWFGAHEAGEVEALHARLREAMPTFDHAMCVPVSGPQGRAGIRFEAANAKPVDTARVVALIDALAPADTADARYDDARRHRARRLWIDGSGADAVLRGLLIAGPEGEGAWLFDVWRRDERVAPYGRALLSPDAAAPTTLAPREPQICNCFDISQGRIVEALRTIDGDDTAARLRALQGQLRCGTQCGSCLPTLRRLVNETAAVALAAG